MDSISYQGQLSNAHAPLTSNVRHTVVDVDEFIINEVHRHPHLYDMKHNDYRDLVKRRNSFAEIGKMLQMSGDDVQCKWRGLRDRFMEEKKTIEDRIRSGAQMAEIRYSKYYHAMTFIADYICIRHSTSNLDSEADDPNNIPIGDSQPSMELEDLSQAYSEILDASPDPSLEPVNNSFPESDQDQRPLPAFSPAICATSRSSTRSMVHRRSPSPARSVEMPRLPGPPPKCRRENTNNNETSLTNAIEASPDGREVKVW